MKIRHKEVRDAAVFIAVFLAVFYGMCYLVTLFPPHLNPVIVKTLAR